MKKVILVAVVLVAGLSASCQKSYTCTCDNGSGNVTTTTVKGFTLAGAETQCASKGAGCAI
jgi:hypothetical protein